MEIIHPDVNVDFIKYRKVAVFGSIAVNILILLGVALFGLNMGVDFAGGSEIEAEFAQEVSAQQVRERVESAGFREPQVQQYGNPSEHDFLIRVGRVSMLSKEQAVTLESSVKAALGSALTDYRFNPDLGDKVELGFGSAPDEAKVRQAFESQGVGVMGIQSSKAAEGAGYEVTVTTRGVAYKIAQALRGSKNDTVDLRRIDYVGPQVGKELRNRGIMAVLYAMAAILLYVFFRFDFRFAPGGVIALVHDVIVVLGYYVVSRREFNLTSVAVLLTIVGYSINDTIVVYDRIRENMGKYRGKDFPTIINRSINETLSRTILTSGATALSLVGLLIFGVGSIWDFAAAMMVGIITGTYSSIYIASPVTIWLEEQLGKHGHLKPGSGAAEASKPDAQERVARA